MYVFLVVAPSSLSWTRVGSKSPLGRELIYLVLAGGSVRLTENAA